MLVSWNDRYASGIDIIDTGHGLVIEAINALNETTTARNGRAVAGCMLPALRRHLAGQFTAEEALMAGLPADQRVSHRAEHAHLSETLDFLQNQHDAGADVSGPLLLNLVCFLVSHLRASDAECYASRRLPPVAA